MKPKQKVQMKSPLDIFFKIGDKVTGGDPKRKADFDYYMLWIIFLAFFGIFGGNMWDFIHTFKLQSLGWACFGLAIMWFQYFNLKMMREARKMMKQAVPMKDMKIESKKEMLKEFK